MISDNLQTWFSRLAKTVWFDVDTAHVNTVLAAEFHDGPTRRQSRRKLVNVQWNFK